MFSFLFFELLHTTSVHLQVAHPVSMLKLKLYNEQRNAQVFNLFMYLLLFYMFRAFFSPKHARQK
jgi:hypothetical protein